MSPEPPLNFNSRRGNPVHRTLSSNASGCYELTGLPPGLYVVFAGAPGFASVTRDQIAVSRGRVERRDLEMHVRAICECLGPSTVAEQWKEADAVVRLRITGHEQGPSRGAGLFPYIKHTATVRSVLKRQPMARSTSSTLTFLHVPEGEEQEPFAIGQEFVIFLGWAPTQGRLSCGQRTTVTRPPHLRLRMAESIVHGWRATRDQASVIFLRSYEGCPASEGAPCSRSSSSPIVPFVMPFYVSYACGR